MDLYRTLEQILLEQQSTKELVQKLLDRQKKYGYELDDTVSPKEAAKLIRCSERKVHDLLGKGALPYAKIDRKVYIRVADLQDLLINGTK